MKPPHLSSLLVLRDWLGRRSFSFLVPAAFLAASLLGALLLVLPFAQRAGHSVGLLDCWFTASSAVCVTGLIVADTGSAFSPFGQGVILLLIQLGGIGIMTFSFLVLLAVGRGVSGGARAAIADAYVQDPFVQARRFILQIALFTFAVEGVGVLCLFALLFSDLGWGALPVALFHSVSAFCNAGFSLFSDSLMRFHGRPLVGAVIMALIIIGGLGYTVVFALSAAFVRRRRFRTPLLGLHVRLVLWSTAILIVAGTLPILALEWNHAPALGGLDLGARLQAGLFQSVTCRTAGFNTVDIGALRTSTLLLMMFLMWVGGSPGSCAGGVKTSTLALALIAVRQRLQGRRRIVVGHREVRPQTVQRAITLLALSLLIGLGAVFALLVVLEGAGSPLAADLRGVAFQVVSALGTVGLSVWDTAAMAALPALARLLLIALMFIGRIGPLALAPLVVREQPEPDLRYPEENVLIG